MTIRRLAEVEKEAILAAVHETGDVQEAARQLGIGRTTVYRKLFEYGYSIKRFVDAIEHLQT